MLTIRPQQMRLFRPELERVFMERVADWVEQKHPGPEVADRAALERRVFAAFRRARGYSMQSRRDLARFVDLDMRLGPSFEMRPENAWMKAILSQPSLSPPTKIHRIECRLERLAAIADSYAEESDA